MKKSPSPAMPSSLTGGGAGGGGMMDGGGSLPFLAPAMQLQERLGDWQSWLSMQPVVIESAFSGAVGALQGAVIGGCMSIIADELGSGDGAGTAGKPALLPFGSPMAHSGSAVIQARNCAVAIGVNCSVSSAMKRIRGAEDLQSSVVSAFCSGAAYSLVSGEGGPNKAANALLQGLYFAIAHGSLFKLGEVFRGSKSKVDDPLYSKGRSMLANLGLQKYNRNFEKGMLSDATLPLLTDRALREVNIPPGPRLLILDHIQRGRQELMSMNNK